MFSICRSDQTRRGLACLALILLCIAACSPDRPSNDDTQNGAPVQPLVELQPSTASAQAEDVLVSEVAAGGIPATYRATFTDNQLRRIDETRAEGAATPNESSYEFQGARLMSYVGAPLGGAGAIEIQFNLQGAVTMSRAASGDVAPEEIAAIRTRAQLLRSHALAQRATRTHATR